MTEPMTMPNGLFRMIDANADRAAEGLRVAGDLCRFLLDDGRLSMAWREVRGGLWQVMDSLPGLQSCVLQSRDSKNDSGRDFPSARYQEATSIAKQNIHRAQESIRTLEECMRSVDPDAVSRFSALRYRCYDLEPETIVRIETWAMKQRLDFGLYVVLGNEFSRGRDFIEVARRAIAGGAGAIQLRDKSMSARELLPWAYRLRELTAKHNTVFIINDHIELSLAVDADGVHLGQEDFPLKEARRILGPQKIIGLSTHSVAQAQQAVADGCSYFNIGPVFATQTKNTAMDAVTPARIDEVVQAVPHHPFTVMGGIKLHNVDELLRRGAKNIAVVTAVIAQEDITAAAKAFSDKIRSYSLTREKQQSL